MLMQGIYAPLSSLGYLASSHELSALFPSSLHSCFKLLPFFLLSFPFFGPQSPILTPITLCTYYVWGKLDTTLAPLEPTA